MSERGGSDIKRLWNWVSRSSQNELKMTPFKFRVVQCRIRLYPTLTSKKWLGSGLPLKIKFWTQKDPEESDDDRLLLEEIERALSDELTVEEILGLGVKLDKLETQMVSQNGRFELTKPLRKGTRWRTCHHENPLDGAREYTYLYVCFCLKKIWNFL